MYTYNEKKILYTYLSNIFQYIDNNNENDVNLCNDIINIIKNYKENSKYYTLNNSVYNIIFNNLSDDTIDDIFDYLINEKNIIDSKENFLTQYSI